jgi:SpoVK/Ycf46/Vps4 family AAA+-type ATPase
LDKAGLNNAAQGNSGNEVTGSVLQMVLTELALPDNKMIVGFTGNRLGGFPPELLRKGRVNEVCFVDLPDFEIRHQILVTKVRQKRFDLTSSDESKLALLAEDNITDGCSGAELTSFVEDAVRRAGVTKSKRLDIDWMIEKAKTFTPLSKTPEWAGDLQKMREACKTFMLLGRSQTSCTSSGSEPSRVQRRSRRDD